MGTSTETFIDTLESFNEALPENFEAERRGTDEVMVFMEGTPIVRFDREEVYAVILILNELREKYLRKLMSKNEELEEALEKCISSLS